jgi:hypothetical protein
MSEDGPKMPEAEDTRPERVVFAIAIREQADGDLQIVCPEDSERHAVSVLRDAQDILSQRHRERKHSQEHPILSLPKRIKLH